MTANAWIMKRLHCLTCMKKQWHNPYKAESRDYRCTKCGNTRRE